MLLSILIPSLETRKHFLDSLINMIMYQDGFNNDEVEVLTFIDNRENTTGHKRNILIERAKGKFVVFIDDDDKISDDYISKILEAIKSNPIIDVIGINGVYTHKGKQTPFETSLEHHWDYEDGMFLRYTNHISPILRDHAIKIKFPNKTIGEDFEWTMKLKKSKLLKNQIVIKSPLYYYNFIANKKY
jgi:glycosyltransferase involved in cell wall biosynthesis